MNFLRKFFRPTTDHVVSDFQKTVNRLAAVADRHYNKGVKHNFLSDKHASMAVDAHAEATKASNVAKKIAALLA